MCIRDSYPTPRPIPIADANPPVAHSLAGIGVVLARDEGDFGLLGVADKTRGCLLYTSDAADDLLCVDLGGRRIIKKKTPKQHNTQPHTYQHSFTEYLNSI